MGSLDKYCRLCASNMVPDQLLHLFGDSNPDTEEAGETPETGHAAKLRTFLNFSVSSDDRLPKTVCVTCVTNLDYCIQFVDRCRRVESLLQRGLDVDYVASEADFRYTYLFPAPYPGPAQDSASRFQDFADTAGGGAFFGPTPSSDEGVPQSQSSDLPRPGESAAVSGQSPPSGPGTADTGPRAGIRSPGMGPRESQGKGSSKQDLVKISSKTDLKTSPTQQKVPMFKNDVSVDNMVVEIEPNDLIPRKSGNVKPEYPWKVGGPGRRTAASREKKAEADLSSKTADRESPCKRMRTILPKSHTAPEPSVAARTSSQIMIPVTLRTPCKTCHQVITASSLQELKQHVCNVTVTTKEQHVNSVECEVSNCGKMFGNKKSLQYHQKHCHEGQLTNRKPPMDIMTIATNELVGVGVSDRKQVSSSLNTNYGLNQSFSVPKPQQTAVQVAPKKIFACPYEGCNKSYHAKTYLIEHERLHTGERPYSCSNCGKCFSRVLDMKKHNLLKVCF